MTWQVDKIINRFSQWGLLPDDVESILQRCFFVSGGTVSTFPQETVCAPRC